MTRFSLRISTLLCATAVCALLPMETNAAPDLTGQVTPSVTPQGSTSLVSFDIKILNLGNAGCGVAWWADFWASYPCACSVPPSACNQASDANWDFTASDLAAGTTLSKSFNLQLSASPTPYRYLLYVDSALGTFGNFCAEGNETNNIICGEYSVTGPSVSPDLVIEACSAEPDPADLSLTRFTMVVKNQGTASTSVPVGLDLFSDAGNLVCADALNEPGDAWVQVPALAPGQSTTVTKSVAVPGGLFTLLAVVNGFAEVSEPSTGNNCCTHGYEVTDRPDFTIPSFYYSMQGSLPLFEGVIRNDGFKSVDPDQLYKLCLYYDRTDQPSPCETPDVEAGEGAVLEFSQGLAVGGEQLFSMYGPPLPNGVYSVWARADCDCQILEADEKNNDAKEEVILDVPGPDLQVKIFEGTQVQGAKGNAVGYMVVVTNAGSEPVTDSFDLDLFFNVAELPTKDNASAVTEGLYVQGPPLEPGAFYQKDVVWDRPDGIPDGTYVSWAVLDLFSMWPETNEQNNARSETVEIVTKAGPNLDLSDFRSRVVGNRVLFTVTVTNNGDAPVEAPFRMDLFRDRENPPALGDLGDAYQEVPGLAAAESTVWESEWPLAPDGEYYAFALVDSSNAIVEANEADNIAGPRIVVVCSTCQLCPPDEYLTTPCVCGEETVYSGYCCDQEWFALGCPSQTDVVADASFPDGQVIEFEPPLKRSSSCAVNETTNSGIALLLLFGLLLLALRHSRFRSPSL